MLQKDDAEHPVPEPLRSTFRQIADAFTAGDFQLRDHSIDGVRPIDPDTAKWIADNISAYGEALAPLNEETWDRSIYRWMDGYWQLLVDLTTISEPVSDLTLHAKLFEAGGDFALAVEAVTFPSSAMSAFHPLRSLERRAPHFVIPAKAGTQNCLPVVRNQDPQPGRANRD